MQTPTMNSIVLALRFFFTHTIDRPDLTRKLIRVAHPRNLPVVLSRDEVARLLNATTCLKHQAALSVAYGGPARGRGSGAQGRQYRQLAHTDPGRVRQGWPVSQCHALGRSAHPAARVVEGHSRRARESMLRRALLQACHGPSALCPEQLAPRSSELSPLAAPSFHDPRARRRLVR
jgi:hypothetical protein